MTAPRILFSDLVDLVDCPSCGAGPRTPCGTRSGDVALQSHSARIRAASQALRQLFADLGYARRERAA
jgi:hypothetical protein